MYLPTSLVVKFLLLLLSTSTLTFIAFARSGAIFPLDFAASCLGCKSSSSFFLISALLAFIVLGSLDLGFSLVYSTSLTFSFSLWCSLSLDSDALDFSSLNLASLALDILEFINLGFFPKRFAFLVLDNFSSSFFHSSFIKLSALGFFFLGSDVLVSHSSLYLILCIYMISKLIFALGISSRKSDSLIFFSILDFDFSRSGASGFSSALGTSTSSILALGSEIALGSYPRVGVIAKVISSYKSSLLYLVTNV